ncbi:hypothetical protein L6164_001761 [Bauhinia variegata]|uniref:Uncharacterized protein n=1 Tax=Bauhinia variegata TaxID=167791 RepID=A0ACB9QAL5_BAUVA|nr:hypothetical protein L6164_001761 [Bauhinia variegata]
MVTDAEGSRRKHRRSSSPEEVERSSKRHKHRHHGHRHHRHRHGSTKYEEEIIRDDETVATVATSNSVVDSRLDKHRPEEDLEEGEILEEEVGEIGKKHIEPDADSGEIQVTRDRDARSDTAILGLHVEDAYLHEEAVVSLGETAGIKGKLSKTKGEDIYDEKFVTSTASDGEDRTFCQSGISHRTLEDYVSPTRSTVVPQDKKDRRASRDGLVNGNVDSKSSKEVKRLHGELGSSKGIEKPRSDYGDDDDDSKANGSKLIIHRNSSSESAGEKHRTSRNSPSRYRYRSQSRSSGCTRDRSRSRSKEYTHSKRRHLGEQGALSYGGRDKTDYDLDDERMEESSRGHGHDSKVLIIDDAREHSSSYSSKYAGKEDRHHSQETRDRSKERDVDRDLKREKERERSRNKEIDRVLRREKERERSHERDRRDVEKDRRRGREMDRDRRRDKEWDRSFDAEVDRDRRREKERDRSRDRTRGGVERDRDRDIERDDRNRSRDRIRERERERKDNRIRNKDKESVNDKDRHLVDRDGHDSRDRYRRSRHSNLEETEYHQDRKRNSERRNSMANSLEGGENKPERGEYEQDDYEEKDTLQFAEQEEEDLNRIKEESRRRREAILEKYKQRQRVDQTPENEEKDKEPVDIPVATPEVPDGKNGVDVYDAETTFAVGKSPENENVASEKTSGAGGLGEGTPKSEGSNDVFCDDIFGETPTGVRKLGKGDGLRIERSGLHDNWDDAEGYYSYRFGEILDGRYEVTAAHGRGVFSTVVRAKNLKSGNGEPEEVAVKIIRNNDTMYKAGMDELVILKKLVGADPEDKRHCVRFLSSFKYRNHLCLVFESLHMNLREVLKKFGRNIGLKLTAVRAYAKQLFIALKHLRNCGVLHCDIKPDNMLVNEAKNVLKLCDFGNAMFAGKNEVTPYLVSRFYRAPEIILGLQYDHPLDIWSVGCCLYELYTGKVLFPGHTNNDMLRLHMELKGPFPKKMLRKGAFTEQHFDLDLNFLATEEDPVTKKMIKRMILNIKPKDIGTIITGFPGEDPKMLANFKDLLEKVFVLDPDKRLTVSQALNHPFITGKITSQCAEATLQCIDALRDPGEGMCTEVFGFVVGENLHLYSNHGPAIFNGPGLASPGIVNRFNIGWVKLMESKSSEYGMDILVIRPLEVSAIVPVKCTLSSDRRNDGNEEITTSIDSEDLWSTELCIEGKTGSE